MATVNIYLENDETEDQIKEDLVKAFLSQTNGDTHTEDFQQPLPKAVVAALKAAHQNMLKNMYREIQTVVGKGLLS